MPDFFVFEQTLRNGVFVAAGDLTGDGAAELVVGLGIIIWFLKRRPGATAADLAERKG